MAVLGLAVFLQLAAAGQLAIIQGTRQIATLALLTVLSAAAATLASIGLVAWLGLAGVAPAVVATGAFSLALAVWFRRRSGSASVRVTVQEALAEGRSLVRLGVVFMVSALLMAGAAYAIRLIVLDRHGVFAAGLYQAAWSLGGLYAGFILQAMGTDFYPRLTAVAEDNASCNQLVNEQVHVSILLAGPGVLGTLTLAPLIIQLFYTHEFVPAVDILRWICLGMMLRIVSWPMGFIVLAKGASRFFFWVEVAAAIVHVGLAWLLVPYLGAVGAGAAFCGLYVWHSVVIYFVVRRLSGFTWTRDNLKLMALNVPAVATVFVIASVVPFWPALGINGLITAVVGVACLRKLMTLLPGESIPALVRPFLPAQP